MEMRLPSLNDVKLSGRVAMPPEMRYTTGGMAVMEFRLVYNRRWKDKKTGDWREEPNFFTVNVWGEQAERLTSTLEKGSPVLVEGELRQRSWEAKDGGKRSVVEITASRVQNLAKSATKPATDTEQTAPAPGRGDAAQEQRQSEQGASGQDEQPGGAGGPLDDIPFV